MALNGVLIAEPKKIETLLILTKFYQTKYFQKYFDHPGHTMVLTSGGLPLRSAYSDKQLITEVVWGEDFMRKILPGDKCHRLISFDEEVFLFQIYYNNLFSSGK